MVLVTSQTGLKILLICDLKDFDDQSVGARVGKVAISWFGKVTNLIRFHFV